MPDSLSFAEIDAQHMELLPARTVLSLFSADGPGGGDAGNSAGAGIFDTMSNMLGHQVNSAGSGVGGGGGSANAGHGG
jgi:hypothetical protein